MSKLRLDYRELVQSIRAAEADMDRISRELDLHNAELEVIAASVDKTAAATTTTTSAAGGSTAGPTGSAAGATGGRVAPHKSLLLLLPPGSEGAKENSWEDLGKEIIAGLSSTQLPLLVWDLIGKQKK